MAVLRSCSKWMSGQNVPTEGSSMEDQKEETTARHSGSKEGASPSFAPRNRALSRSSEESDSCCSGAAECDTASYDSETQGSPMKITKTLERPGENVINGGKVIVVSTESKVSLEREISSLNAEFLKKTLEDVKSQVTNGGKSAPAAPAPAGNQGVMVPTHKPSPVGSAPGLVAAKSSHVNITEPTTTTPTGKKKSQKRKTPPSRVEGQSTGRWTHVEHEAFLDGLKVFGREWKKVAKLIPTRSSAQVRSHAQKYFAKLDRDESVLMLEQKALENNNVHANIPPSVQRNVERILANPASVEQQVQDTMNALQERYRELQRQLEEHPINQEQQQATAVNVLSESDDNESRGSKKRRREGENGSCCSSAAASTLGSLGNEELIALSVLGGALANVQPAAAAAAAGAAAEDNQVCSTDTSLASSEASWASTNKEEDD